MVNNRRSKVIETKDGLIVLIPSKKNWFVLILGTLWVFGLLSFFYFFLFHKVKHSPDFSIKYIAITIQSLVMLGVICYLLWGFLGKESIIINSSNLILRRSILGIGITQTFEKKEIQQLRFEFDKEYTLDFHRLSFYGLGTGKVKFDYGFKSFSFRLGVDDPEAKNIVEMINEKIK